ncbi:MAG: four helix bundle protein [Acidobacteriota bacterium]|nr:MAG: four helix bundle protein [Acidobacteriota bacterium]
MNSRSFEDLLVWQKAHQLVLDVYQITDSFPQREIYSLTNQLRRAAVSVPANIAEGYRKSGPADKSRFLNIAQGSLEEVRYYLILARDLHYSETTEMRSKVDEVARMLYAYHRAIKRTQ